MLALRLHAQRERSRRKARAGPLVPFEGRATDRTKRGYFWTASTADEMPLLDRLQARDPDQDELVVIRQTRVAPLVWEVVVAAEEELLAVEHVDRFNGLADHREGIAESDITLVNRGKRD